MQSFELQSIGYIRSCYKEKFGIPRQPNLVNVAKSQLVLNEEFNQECIRGLEGFSHIWLQFLFHATQQQGWKSLVRPPRLGGNKKVGVFASRSTFRPNPIGLSVVQLKEIEIIPKQVILHLRGCDLLDHTPIFDIKPYLPYADAILNAEAGFAADKPCFSMDVVFSTEAMHECESLSEQIGENLEQLISQILALDPRPSYQQNNLDEDRIYAMKLYNFDLRWQYCENNKIKVLSINS